MWSANKFWSGLLKDYYLPRASTYFAHLLKSLEHKVNFMLEEWRREWIQLSNKWQAGTESYSIEAVGDASAISHTLYDKYFN